MNNTKRALLMLSLSFYIAGGLTLFAPQPVRADKVPVVVGKPVITPDPPKTPPKKDH